MKIHNPDNVYDLQKILYRLLRSKRKLRTESVLLSNSLMHDIAERIIRLENRIQELEIDK